MKPKTKNTLRQKIARNVTNFIGRTPLIMDLHRLSGNPIARVNYSIWLDTLVYEDGEEVELSKEYYQYLNVLIPSDSVLKKAKMTVEEYLEIRRILCPNVWAKE